MARLFAIGDTHLPSTRGKTMDRFGWSGHPTPLAKAWDEVVKADDVVLLVGDISWATRPAEVLPDLAWIDARPGRKLLVRGNHDFWWSDSRKKQTELLAGFPSIVGFLHNGSAARVENYVIAGTRGWTCPEAPPLPGGEMGGEDPRPDLVVREADRLTRSIAEAGQMRQDGDSFIVAMHFPPLYSNERDTAFSTVLSSAKPKVCIYGHLHGPGIPAGFVGERAGIRYQLVSCDAARFSPVEIVV
jgi:uncharacterized protein